MSELARGGITRVEASQTAEEDWVQSIVKKADIVSQEGHDMVDNAQ